MTTTEETTASEAPEPVLSGGEWFQISFLGHVELTGYVTEITLGGQPAWHVDLPEKIWGGNELAWQEYAGTALYSRRPVTEKSVRDAWESARASQAAYEARMRQYAIGPSDYRDMEQGPFLWPGNGSAPRRGRAWRAGLSSRPAASSRCRPGRTWCAAGTGKPARSGSGRGGLRGRFGGGRDQRRAPAESVPCRGVGRGGGPDGGPVRLRAGGRGVAGTRCRVAAGARRVGRGGAGGAGGGGGVARGARRPRDTR